jgi:energy-converting hydrogenase Eha subunit C
LNANPLLRSVFQIGITLILASISYVNVFVAAAAGAAIITVYPAASLSTT